MKTKVNTRETLENGMSIRQLEERYELSSAGEKCKGCVDFDISKYDNIKIN